MADEAVEFLLNKLSEVRGYTDQLIQGQEAIRWIEYELETLIPQLERIEAATGLSRQTKDLVGRIRDTISTAAKLEGTHTKTERERDAAATFKPIYELRLWITSWQLHRIKAEISTYRGHELFTRHLPESAAEEQTVPPHLRRWMHYLLLFPPTYQVPARRLVALWLAEDPIHSKKHGGHLSAKQIVKGYLDELLCRGLIIKQEKPTGKVTYSINAANRKALMQARANNNELGVRRLVDCNGSTTPPYFIQIPVENAASNFSTSYLKGNYKNVISFLSFNPREGSKPGEDIGEFLRKCISKGCFIWLRMLDLERVFRPKLPDTLGELITMKYLGLRWTYLEQLPDSVEKLFYLQVLDVKHTYLSVLPSSIWRMQYLQHLYLNEAYRTRFPQPPSEVTLNTLQTLWGAFVDEETAVQGGFDKLLNIKKLGLSCRSSTSSSTSEEMKEKVAAIDKWISNLEFLETLRLKSRDEENKAADLHLTSLKENGKLSTLYLLGKLDSRIICTFPFSLTDITLSGSHLDLDPMRYLGKLPNLLNLRLLGQSVICAKLSCFDKDFQKLKLLWIWKLESLVDFEAQKGSLPCLEELEIRDCPNLEKLPQLKNLKVKFTNMQHKIEEAMAVYDQFEAFDILGLQLR